MGYAATVYLVFLAVLGYAAGFFADFAVPRGIDRGPHAAWPAAVAIDLLLLSLFAVQHTVMARPWFKRRWTRVIPEPAERASFVLAASLTLALLCWLWQPVGGTAWSVSGPAAAALWALYAAGWAAALGATFLVSHVDLFGLRQAWLHARHVRYSAPAFTERGVYGHVRHPLMAAFVVVFWSAPVMTSGHVLFAAAATGYILVGIAFEERDLIESLGSGYADYRARVPALIRAHGPGVTAVGTAAPSRRAALSGRRECAPRIPRGRRGCPALRGTARPAVPPGRGRLRRTMRPSRAARVPPPG